METQAERNREETSLRYILKLSWPAFIEVALQIMVGNMDQIMVSHYSQQAVGGISNANVILSTLLITFNMVSAGTVILVAQYKGAGREEELDRIYTLSCLLNICLGLASTLIIFAFDGAIFRFMRVDGEFIPHARRYLRVVGCFCLAQGLFQALTAIFRANKLMRTGMVVSALVNLVNLGGNALLIHGAGPIPALGAVGAAIATGVSQSVGVLIMLVLFYRRLHRRLSLAYVRPFPGALLRRLLALSIPAGGDTLSYRLAEMVTLSFINSFGSASTLAKSYTMVITNLTMLYATSVARSVQIVVGYQVGAGDWDGADRVVKRTAASSVMVSLPVILAMYLCSDGIFSLFHASPEVLAVCKGIMLIEIPLEMCRSFNRVFVQSLQGAGDVQFTVRVGILSTWGVIVGLGYLFGVVFHLGIYGIWCAMALDELIRGTTFMFRWRGGTWRSKSVVKAEQKTG